MTIRIMSESDETHLRVLRVLAERPEISQRELAEELGVSVGKANYCLRALLERGFVKVQNFRNSTNKRAYAYLLTPEGIKAKAGLTARFLKRKLVEYESLRHEIEVLKAEASSSEPQRPAQSSQ